MDDQVNVSMSALLWTGVAGVIILVLRQVVLSFFSAKNQIVQANAQDTIVTRLQDEIKRLENIIVTQNKRLEELERRLDEVILHEIEDAEDIAELSHLFDHLCAGSCEGENWLKVKAALKRLKERRKERHQNEVRQSNGYSNRRQESKDG